MKKTILLVFASVLLMATQTAMAQVQFAVGIKAGPNFATINTDASAQENYKNRTGFHGGAFVLIKATKIGIQPEVIFSQQGSTVRINSQDYESNFSYVNVPIIIKLYTVAGINIQAGPQFGFVNSAEAPVLTAPNTYSVQDVKNRAKGSDVTAALGLGWDLPFGLTIDARYNLGLSKIYKQAPTNETADAKNQVIQFSLGYKLFKVGK
ncbi:MAG TPA: porin family protein [Chryseosolibacter sp.]